MAKLHKKRNKKYRGRDAAEPNNLLHVRKSTAIVRSDRAQWLHDHRKLVRNIAIGVAITIIIIAVIASIH